MPSLNQLMARLSDMFGVGPQAVPLANRNLYVDGAFDSFTTNNAVALSNGTISSATMWYGSAGVGGAAVHQIAPQRAYSNVMALMDSEPYNALAHNQTTASTGTWAALNLPWIAQKVEGVQRLSGKSVTLSCKIWASANVTLPGVYYSQSYGTGGSPTAPNTQGKALTWNVTNTPQKFSVRIDIPAMPSGGVTFGTNSNDFCSVGVFMPANWTGTIYTTEWQLEYCNPNASNDLNGKGGSPTAFEYRGLAAELARVQRYYRSYPANGASYNGALLGSGVAYGFGLWPEVASMRNAPAASLTGTWNFAGPNVSGGTVSLAVPSGGPPYLQCTPITGGTIGYAGYFNVSVAGAVIFDARL